MADQDNVLSLSTAKELKRPSVRIDGELYEMRAAGEMNLGTMRRIGAIEAELEGQTGGETVPLNRQVKLLEEMLELCMPELPAEVSDRLSFEDLGEIVSTFFALAGKKRPAEQTDTPQP